MADPRRRFARMTAGQATKRYRHAVIQTLALTAAAVFTVELVIMLGFYRHDRAPVQHLVESLIDSSVLTLVLYPILHLLLYRPLLRDISNGIRAEEFRNDYLLTICHDLRTPLTSILGQAQLLERTLDRAGLNGLHLERRGAEAIISNAQRMNQMIQGIVESAYLEARQVALDKAPVDVRALVSELLGRSEGTIDARRVEVDMPLHRPTIKADRGNLDRIFTNLLTNALKYSSEETSVVVRAETVGNELVVSVMDRGIGISPGDLPHIFERFYRSKGIRQMEGMGLGLYVARNLVEAQGGRIWARSTLGEGTTFCFSMPLVK